MRTIKHLSKAIVTQSILLLGDTDNLQVLEGLGSNLHAGIHRSAELNHDPTVLLKIHLVKLATESLKHGHSQNSPKHAAQHDLIKIKVLHQQRLTRQVLDYPKSLVVNLRLSQSLCEDVSWILSSSNPSQGNELVLNGRLGPANTQINMPNTTKQAMHGSYVDGSL